MPGNNNRTLSRSNRWLVQRLLIIVALVILLLSGPARPLRQGMIIAAQPLARFLHYVGAATSPLRAASSAENDERLRGAQARLLELEAENKQLREAANFAASFPRQTVGATIIGSSGQPTARQVRIDQGTDNGVKLNAAVLVDGYLVGKVVTVESKSAWVQLITDPDFRLTVTVGEATTAGLAHGSFGGLTVERIPLTDAIKEGDAVLSSSIGDQVPSGIPLGIVSRVRSQDSVFHEINVEVPIQLETLRIVQVVVS